MVRCEGCGEDIGTKEEIMEDMVEAHKVERNNTVEILCEACYHEQPLGSLREDYEAESFEATEWIGFCPECNKWRTKEMSVKIDSKINTTTLNEIGNTTSTGEIIKTNNQQIIPKKILKKKGEKKIVLFLIL